MKVTAVKTHKITSKDADLFAILDQYIPTLEENSVVTVTSKIISIIEGRTVPMDSTSKDELIEEESQHFLPRDENKWHVGLTVARDNLVASAGIDESNGNGDYILWPRDPQKNANEIREHLVKKFNVKNIGVVITDSKTTPLRWGTTGFSLAHSGFAPVRDYIGKPDIFGRKMEYTKLNVADSLASMAVLAMGEGEEQQPIAVVEGLKDIEFQDRNPSEQELKELQIHLDEDLYSVFLKNAPWKKGRQP